MNSLIFSEAGSEHPAAGAWSYGVLGEVVKGVKTLGKCRGFSPHPEVTSGVPHAVGEGYW